MVGLFNITLLCFFTVEASAIYISTHKLNEDNRHANEEVGNPRRPQLYTHTHTKTLQKTKYC